MGHEELLDLEVEHVGVEVMADKVDVDKEVEHVEGSLVLNQSIGFQLVWLFRPSLSCMYVIVKMPIEERLKELIKYNT